MTTAIRKQTALWTCKNGQKVRVCDMEDRHLLNTIAFIERTASRLRPQTISAAYSVLSALQGDMATFYCEQDIAAMEEMSPEEFIGMPILGKLMLEKERRGL